MGLRGPAPKPTSVRILEGNRARRPLNPREPKPRPDAPKCPRYIRSDPVARKEWRRLVPILTRMKVLTEADGLVLANLCLAHSALLLNLAKMRELNAQGKSGLGGMVIQTKSGYLALNQIYANVQASMEQELKLCRELGLTPSSRSRVLAEKPADKPLMGSTLNGMWKAS